MKKEVSTRMTDEERAALKATAARVGMSVAALVRQAIRREIGLPTSVEAVDTNGTERDA